MNKIIRFYNQNRKEFFMIIIIIIFILGLIQFFNKLAEEQKEQETQNNTNTYASEAYKEESQTIVSEKSIPAEESGKSGNIIDNFMISCTSGNTSEAYNLLSDDCKNAEFPTLDEFENFYYKPKFSTPKSYTFQSWSYGSKNIYIVKIYENSLATGVASDDYIQDYFTIVKENGKTRLNINSYLGEKTINGESEQDGLTIQVEKSKAYMDYCIYTIKVKNNTEKNVLLDTKKKTTTVYAKTTNENTVKSMIYEKNLNDLYIKSGEEKEIEIKFNINYSETVKIDSIVFSDIVMDYDTYAEDGLLESERSYLKINI